MILQDTGRKGVPRILSLRVELVFDQADDRNEFGFLVKLERGFDVPIN